MWKTINSFQSQPGGSSEQFQVMFREQALGKPLWNTCQRVIQAFKSCHINTQNKAFKSYQHLLFVKPEGYTMLPPPYTFITWISSSSTPNCCWLTVRVFLPICCNYFMLRLYWSVEDVQVGGISWQLWGSRFLPAGKQAWTSQMDRGEGPNLNLFLLNTIFPVPPSPFTQHEKSIWNDHKKLPQFLPPPGTKMNRRTNKAEQSLTEERAG